MAWGAWDKIREQLPAGLCFCCTVDGNEPGAAHANSKTGCCSICTKIVCEMQGSSIPDLTDLDPDEVRARCAADPRIQAWKLSQDDERLLQHLDEVVGDKTFSEKRFKMILKVVERQRATLVPEQLLALLTGDPFQLLNEAQGAELFALVAELPRQSSFSHIICSHVLTSWRMSRNKDDPTLGDAECYYDFWKTHERPDIASRLLSDPEALADDLLLDCVEAFEKRDVFLEQAREAAEAPAAAEAHTWAELPQAPTSSVVSFPSAPTKKVVSHKEEDGMALPM